ncbi:MAG: nucleotidyltransferase domain-containing protein [Oscillospiraceae bacterium]|jgi:predicted nucleotidyltransferase|nr:nucleotidyltransferase domain-containing protein [Oscillospiraceae bacterium]
MQHHEESIQNMTLYFRATPEIKALFLIGSVATGTERPDSDIDGVAVVSEEYYAGKKENGTQLESVWGKCTYEGGYFDVHYMTRRHLVDISEVGTEPSRNMFSCARPLFCDEPDLLEITAKIPVFQQSEKAAKQLRYYCTFKQFYSYYWSICKPRGSARIHTANGMIFSLYRLILLENEILFPSVRKLEEAVRQASNKPDNILKKCEQFISTFSDEDALDLIESYHDWTSYDYPKDFQYVANHFIDPYESQ